MTAFNRADASSRLPPNVKIPAVKLPQIRCPWVVDAPDINCVPVYEGTRPSTSTYIQTTVFFYSMIELLDISTSAPPTTAVGALYHPTLPEIFFWDSANACASLVVV